MACREQAHKKPYETAIRRRRGWSDERENRSVKNFSIPDLIWLLSRPTGLANGSGFGLSPEEVMRLNFAQIENMMRQADKMGQPIKRGVREDIAAERDAQEAREANNAIWESLAMTPPRSAK